MLDVPFMKSQVLNLEAKAAEALQAVHEINGALTYARNLLAHAEELVAAAAEKAAADEATADANRQDRDMPAKIPDYGLDGPAFAGQAP